MINYTRILLVFLFIAGAFSASAQTTATTSSPYSRYGLGLIDDQLLPQTRGMGGIAAGVNEIGGFSNINMLNPSSYSNIRLTAIDIGIYTNISLLSQTGVSHNDPNTNTRLSHVAFGIPVTKRSALSFGLMPYSELGYNYTISKVHKSASPYETDTTMQTVYSGEGGLSKAYFGYGFGIGKHLKLGANVSYIFGNLHNYSTVGSPDLYGTYSGRVEESNSIGGLNYDYGAQYTIDFGDTRHLTFGYSASLSTKLNSQYTYLASQFSYDSKGNENLAADTLINTRNTNAKIVLPLTNHFGFTYQNDGKFLVGADYSTSKWSNFSVNGVNQGLQNSQTFNVGGQITPNINSLHNYFARMDYRLGFRYEKTYINVGGTDINEYAATFGFGLPLPRNNFAFYKINFSAEAGKRGTLQNGLIRENFINLHLSFLLNDTWFVRYKYD